MEAVETEVYVIGGRQGHRSDFVESFECFDTVTEQWTVLQNTNIQQQGGCAVVDGTSILLTGGSRTNSYEILEFDSKSKKLEKSKIKLQKPQARHFCAMMILPQLL